MIKIKLEENKRKEVSLKIKIDESLRSNNIIKRIIFDSRYIKSSDCYRVPMKYLEILLKVMHKEIEVSNDSVLNYFEFSDMYDDKYFYITEVDAKYMKKWREEECPDIFKVNIDADNKKYIKETAFKKLNNINI